MILQGYSAGRDGADSEWERIGRTGIRYPHELNFNQYQQGKRSSSNGIQMSSEDMDGAIAAVNKANYALDKDITFIDKACTYWIPVREADAVFAVVDWVRRAIPDNNCPGIDTATQWAIQMAWDLGKHVHLFDEKTGHWREFDQQRGWVVAECPVLTPKFAGIGIVRISQRGRDAIADIYRKSQVVWAQMRRA